MPGRFGRPGLLGTMARTAVISGTASAVNRGVQRRMSAREAARDAERYYPPPQQTYPAPPAAPPQQQAYPQAPQQAGPAPGAPDPAGDDVVAQLERLGKLREAGVLSDDEFAAAKAKLLS